MKTNPCIASLTTAFATLILIPSADAAVTVSDFEITSNTLQFRLSGTFPAIEPPGDENRDFLMIVNATPANPGFVSVYGVPNSWGFTTGNLELLVAGPGYPGFEDHVGLLFADPFTAGQAVDGTVSLIFPPSVFDPSLLQQFQVYWGGYGATPRDGLLLGTYSVPEPSTLFLSLASAGLVGLRRRR
jgi:hypothetical protein